MGKNDLKIPLKPKGTCKYDAAALGEVMLRFDPGENRIRNTRSFNVWEGGGEYNVVRGLHKCFGMDAAIISALAKNEIGLLVNDLISQGGVDTSLIKWMPTDGIGKNCRNGLNFTERGFGIRSALGCSDRGNTAVSMCDANRYDLDLIFGSMGVRWFHTGGIYAALSKTTSETVLKAITAAKKYGTIVSYDLNYRPSLWDHNGGIQKAQEINRKIVGNIDVLFGNEEDFAACLGISAIGSLDHRLNLDDYRRIIQEVKTQFPNLKLIASTLREVNSASSNNWRALGWYDGCFCESDYYRNVEVLDRIGSGDAFASGVIYGMMTGMCFKKSLNFGVAHGALVMTTPGDTSMSSKEEVEDLVNHKGFRVRR